MTVPAPPFRPAFWARSGLAQTVWAGLGPAGPRPALRLERWELPDGDFLRLHHLPGDDRAMRVVLLHGLEGSARSAYVAACARLLAATAHPLTVLEFRGCGGEPNRLLRGYHSGETGDLDALLQELIRREPARPLGLLGWSLGGNVLLKWLGEQGGRAPANVRAACAISPPFDLAAAAGAADRRCGGLLARHFLATLVPKALAKAACHPGALDATAVRACRTFAAFDQCVTAPLHGFRDAAHYWRDASCGPFVPAIRRPTLVITALDDPLCPPDAIPRKALAANPVVQTLLPGRGGHAAFLAGGTPWRPRRWAEAVALRFLLGVR